MTKWRAGSLLAIHFAFGAHYLHWKMRGETLAPIEPSEAFDTLHLGVITVGFIFLATAVLATAIFGRFFCGWGCHILALQDGSASILKRIGISTRPVRSRTLVWAPAIVASYLIFWPRLEHWLAGRVRPEWHVVTGNTGWTSFTTTDLLRSFPGIGITLLTFFVCGFLIVYFLGSRSFCSYACPYGAIFAVADRIAPFRIVDSGESCSACGQCISSCKSNVQVITEVKAYGRVIDTNCMKDLDCVTVCPSGTLAYSVARPSGLDWWARNTSGRTGHSRPFDFTPGEDLWLATLFSFSVIVFRGLYDAISLLLALALASIVAWLLIIGWRLLTRPQVSLGDICLRQQGILTRRGKLVGGVISISLAFLVHSALIRYQLLAGQLSLVDSSVRVLAPDSLSDQESASYGQAIRHFQSAATWGLVTPASLTHELAALELETGNVEQARKRLNEQLAKDPDDFGGRLLLARTWIASGRNELGIRQLEHLVRPEAGLAVEWKNWRILASAHCLLGEQALRERDLETAEREYRRAKELEPNGIVAYLGLGTTLTELRQDEEAMWCFEQAIEIAPESAVAHNNLGSLLSRRGESERALIHYRASIEFAPTNPLPYAQSGIVLSDMERFAEAREMFEAALRLSPGYPPAEAGLREIFGK